MNAIVQYLVNHGYSVVFASVFARQLCLPVPALLFLITAGALAGSGRMILAVALALAVIACVLADLVWYEAGRRSGEQILHFICGPRRTRRPPEKELFPVWAPGSRGGQVRLGTGRGSASAGWAKSTGRS
jgi:membrane protein DedA with SNARE-associated domain